ncbi:MAG TPA: hypothetical protein VFE32_20570 [Puia sp.]|jgi:hypothetical protein|nr:hypothetical protein [Puia sp.]
MYLKKGLQLYSDLPGIEDQITINDGTVLPPESGTYYWPGSYIPKWSWRNLDRAETKLLMTRDRGADFTKSISAGEVTDGVREAVTALELHTLTHIDEVMPQIRKKEEEVKVLNKRLDDFLRRFSPGGNYKFHKITRAMPNRETLTFHYARQKFIYVGLHIDESKSFTPYTAFKSGNRISINLSKETRYLTFVNLSMRQVVKMIKAKADASAPDVNLGNIANLFFTHYPDYPVIRIGIKPYQYYIAPTDNFFHDATTMGNKEIDITIVYTGVFDRIN